jgi:hypothetical protein
MTITSKWVSGIAFVLWMLVASVSVVVGQAAHVRWDIQSFVPPNNVRLLLDSRVVDVTMSYNPLFASRIFLEVIIFQRPYK